MMKVRVVYRGDGGVSILYPAPKSKRVGESEGAWLQRVFTKMMQAPNLKGCAWRDVDHTTLPPSREFRDGWRGSPATGIIVDEALAREVAEARRGEVLDQ